MYLTLRSALSKMFMVNASGTEFARVERINSEDVLPMSSNVRLGPGRTGLLFAVYLSEVMVRAAMVARDHRSAKGATTEEDGTTSRPNIPLSSWYMWLSMLMGNCDVCKLTRRSKMSVAMLKNFCRCSILGVSSFAWADVQLALKSRTQLRKRMFSPVNSRVEAYSSSSLDEFFSASSNARKLCLLALIWHSMSTSVDGCKVFSDPGHLLIWRRLAQRTSYNGKKSATPCITQIPGLYQHAVGYLAVTGAHAGNLVEMSHIGKPGRLNTMASTVCSFQ